MRPSPLVQTGACRRATFTLTLARLRLSLLVMAVGAVGWLPTLGFLGVAGTLFSAKGRMRIKELLPYSCRLDPDCGVKGGRSPSAVGPCLDSSKRQRFEGCTLYCADLHAMREIFYLERAAGRRSNLKSFRPLPSH